MGGGPSRCGPWVRNPGPHIGRYSVVFFCFSACRVPGTPLQQGSFLARQQPTRTMLGQSWHYTAFIRWPGPLRAAPDQFYECCGRWVRRNCPRIFGPKSCPREHAGCAESSAELGMKPGKYMILQLLWCICTHRDRFCIEPHNPVQFHVLHRAKMC